MRQTWISYSTTRLRGLRRKTCCRPCYQRYFLRQGHLRFLRCLLLERRRRNRLQKSRPMTGCCLFRQSPMVNHLNRHLQSLRDSLNRSTSRYQSQPVNQSHQTCPSRNCQDRLYES